MKTALPLVLVLVLLACSHEAPALPNAAAAPAPPAATPSQPPAVAPPPATTTTGAPTLASAGAATCRVGAPHELAIVDRRRMQVAIAWSGRAGLVAWASSEDELAAQPIDADARPTGPLARTSFRKAEGLTVLAAVPRGFIAASAGQLCDRWGNACYQAIGLGADGRALGAPALGRLDGDQNVVVSDHAVGGDVLWTTRDSRWGGGTVGYRIADDGSTLEIPIVPKNGTDLDIGESGDVTIHVVATSPAGNGYVLHEHASATTTGRIARILDTGTSMYLPRLRGFGAHEDGADVRFFEVVDDELVAILDDTIVHIGLDGVMRGRPTRLRDRATLPASIQERVVAAVERRSGHAVLVRRDLLAHELGEPTPLSASMRYGEAVARVAWAGDHFVAIAAEPAEHGLRVMSVRVDCAP